MTDKLNDNDKQRIEQEAKLYAKNHSAAPDKETPDWIITDFRKGAEYATIYERGLKRYDYDFSTIKDEQLEAEFKRLKSELLQRDAIWLPAKDAEIEERDSKIKQLEAERSEMLEVLKNTLQYIPSITNWEPNKIRVKIQSFLDRLNSLKTK